MNALGNRKGRFFEADPAVGLNLAEPVAWAIFEGRDVFAEGSRAQTVAVCGDRVGERLVGPLGIVDAAPRVERGLGMAQRAEGVRHGFGLEAAVEALVLAERLGMIGSGVGDPDAKFDQPDGQGRERVVRGRAPRRTIIRHGSP